MNDSSFQTIVAKCIKYTQEDILKNILLVLSSNDIEHKLVDDGVICVDIKVKEIRQLIKKYTEIPYVIIDNTTNLLQLKKDTVIVFNDISN